MKNSKQIIIALAVSLVMYSCGPADKEFPGSEYMPDMGHAVSVEANAYDFYHYNTWDETSTIKLFDLVKNPGRPVNGTVPRGYAGMALASNANMDVVMGNDVMNGMRVPVNGSVPYYYQDTEESRLLATAEILDNPFPITADGLARGKELYTIFCGICHGEKANGLGYLYDSDANKNAKYLAAPANLVNEEFSAASNGRFYHAIMYGKNVMGGYSDKISYEERWQVIHYIRSLQAKEAKAVYDETKNTFNAAFGVPVAAMPKVDATAVAIPVEAADNAHPTGGEHQTDGHQH